MGFVSITFYLAVLLHSIQFNCAAQFYFEELRQNAKVSNATRITRTSSSLLTCIQFCANNEICVGANYQSNRKECELFSEDFLDERYNKMDGWNIYVVKPICFPNHCRNYAKCIPSKNDDERNDYECICRNDCHIGFNCEKDLSFELDFRAQLAYVSAPIDLINVKDFTMCFTFSGERPQSGKDQLILSQENSKREGIRFIGNYYSYAYEVFDKRFNLTTLSPLAPQRYLPMATCLGLKLVSVNGIEASGFEVKASLGDNVQILGTVDFKQLLISGLLSLGHNPQWPTCAICATFEKYWGKIGFLLMYNRYFSDEEMQGYQLRNWKYDSSLIFSIDEIRDKKYQYMGAKEIPAIDCTNG